MSKPTPDETARRVLYDGGLLTFRQFKQAMFEEHPEFLTDEVLYDLYVNQGRPAPPVVDPASVTQARAAEEHRARMDKAAALEARVRAHAEQVAADERIFTREREYIEVTRAQRSEVLRNAARQHGVDINDVKRRARATKRVVKPSLAERVRSRLNNLLPPRT